MLPPGAASVVDDLASHDRPMGIEQAEGPGLIGIHGAHVACHVSVEDRCETALYD
jgi:hypothetical protein